jgi:hypothetical protein
VNRYERLQKLNKDGTKPPWEMDRFRSGEFGGMFNAPNAPHKNSIGAVSTQLCTAIVDMRTEDAELIVECRNSLPAVLNLIEAARNYFEELTACGMAETAELEAAVAVFVSGQEERSEGAG